MPSKNFTFHLMNQTSALNKLFRSIETTTIGKKRQMLWQQMVSLLYHYGPLSNPELSQMLNISIPTINRSLLELIDLKIVKDLGLGNSSGGRRPNLYAINPEAGYVLAIDISLFSVRIALMNLHNELVGKVLHFDTPIENSPEYVDFVTGKAQKFTQEACGGTDYLIGAGIAIPGLLNPQSGCSFTHLTYSSHPIRDEFREKLGVPVFIDNDARMMTLGEFKFGKAKGKNNILCLNIGAGLGLGMIFDGKIYQGTSGFAGEFGHIKILDDGIQCICGKNGCLETLTSGPALERRVREELGKGAVSSLQSMTEISYPDIIAAALADDPLSIHLIAECGNWLGRGLATLVHLHNPEIIILGGFISQTGHLLLDSINQSLNQCAISKIRREAQIVVSDLGDKAALLGAQSIVINQMFAFQPGRL